MYVNNWEAQEVVKYFESNIKSPICIVGCAKYPQMSISRSLLPWKYSKRPLPFFGVICMVILRVFIP